MRTLPLRIADLTEPLKHSYTISDTGVVYNVSTGKVVRGTSITATNRYRKIHLDKFRSLHRLVAEHFVHNPAPHVRTQVNHIDGNRLNNAADNLEWVTPSQNMLHAYATQLKTNVGEVNPNARLTEADVKRIRILARQGSTDQQIRDSLNLPVSVACVKSIRTFRSWAHVSV